MNHEDLRPLEEWGHDAMWLDNLHHELHVLLTGEKTGYYADFGTIDGLVRELQRPQPERFVVCAQNHDQVGNRAFGDRLPPDAHRVALACVLFSLHTPLVFMGEEYEEQNPFLFFTDHIDPAIAEATREGRRREVERTSGSAGRRARPAVTRDLRSVEARAIESRMRSFASSCRCARHCRASSTSASTEAG